MSSSGEIIRRARLRSGLSQRELARRAGTSQAAISRIERGLEQPTLERLGQILAGLGWKPVIELEPIGAHREEPRRLLAEAHTAPEVRFQSAVNMTRFVKDHFGAATEADG